jgi:hypothetical protein
MTELQPYDDAILQSFQFVEQVAHRLFQFELIATGGNSGTITAASQAHDTDYPDPVVENRLPSTHMQVLNSTELAVRHDLEQPPLGYAQIPRGPR